MSGCKIKLSLPKREPEASGVSAGGRLLLGRSMLCMGLMLSPVMKGSCPFLIDSLKLAGICW